MNTERLIDILQQVQEANDGQPLPIRIHAATDVYEIRSILSEVDDEDNEHLIIFTE